MSAKLKLFYGDDPRGVQDLPGLNEFKAAGSLVGIDEYTIVAGLMVGYLKPRIKDGKDSYFHFDDLQAFAAKIKRRKGYSRRTGRAPK